YYYSEGWRPILPLSFVKAYPKLHALIQECWRVRRKERPNFDEIVKRLQGDIGDEIKRKEEPAITLYSTENDLIYRNRIGKEDEIEDSEGEESGTERGEVVSKAEHERFAAEQAEVVANMKRAMEELREKLRAKEAEVEELASPEKRRAKEKGEAEKKEVDKELGDMLALMGR
ncbi:hypothetical protein TeGR_g3993, partial [Tetraparma gracilis]